jgi:glycosyltransferase involved in cell wall biosynthesis
MRNVLFLYQNEKLPSSRIRILNLLPEIQKEGIQAYAVSYPQSFFEKIRLLRAMKQFDIVYLQKKLISPPEMKVLRKYSKRLFFDFDDAIYCRSDTQGGSESKSRNLKFKYTIQNVDLVIAGNRTLADYTSLYNENVVVIPSGVETRNIPLKNYTAFNSDIILGWVGGKGNLHHLKMLSPIFQKLSLDYRIQVNILCDAAIDIPSVKVRHIPWRLETQEKEIALFDIGIMPLPDNKWTQGKCGYKALQYMAAAIPPVVSDVGSNRDMLQHNREGFLVPSIDGFYGALKFLLDDKNQREKIGLNARKKAEKIFSVHVIGKMLANILK